MIDASSFHGLDSLESLYLDGNNLESIPIFTFSKLKKLKELNFSKNKIKEID
jgi:Leucine-rich repeat (LRR) protein